MRGKRAKQVRRYVYGDYSIRGRKYFRTQSGAVIADEMRQRYQRIKKNIKEWIKEVSYGRR